jgi:hypothetical protein
MHNKTSQLIMRLFLAMGMILAFNLAVAGERPVDVTAASAGANKLPVDMTPYTAQLSCSHPGTCYNCPYGDVCIYPAASWSGTPLTYAAYGYHNLSGQNGTHRILNNQYGGAIMRTCTGYGGTGCQGVLGEFQWEDKDLGPINSIVLSP